MASLLSVPSALPFYPLALTNRKSTMNEDEAFQSLLSSQRELLNQLNAENAMRREQDKFKQTKKKTTPTTTTTSNSMSPPLRVTPNVSNSCFAPIRRSSIDFLYTGSRRLSLGYGHDSFILPDISFDTERIEPSFEDAFFASNVTTTTTTTTKCQRDYADECPPSKKRRMSNFGVTPTFFEDYLKPVSRRGSMLSVINPFLIDDDLEELNKIGSLKEDVFGASSCDDTSVSGSSTSTGTDDDTPLPTPVDFKAKMQAFTSAMERSQKTQQDIHDWDRKMGLKRSHSKTMRLSSRSRKKLRAMLKKEVNALIAANKA